LPLLDAGCDGRDPLAAIADKRRAEAAKIEARVLDHLPAMTLDDLPAAHARWSADGDHVGFSVPWYGMEHASQIGLCPAIMAAMEKT
jgi:hypothetical protein